jgi:nucleoside-diphosphate-sugar epimerase
VRVFVAGATGVLGRTLVPLLIESGHEVIGLARSADAAAAVETLGAKAARADALDRDATLAAIAEAAPDAVVHQATAIPPELDFRKMASQFAQTNALRTDGTSNLLDGADAAGAKRFIAVSIAFAYNPSGTLVKEEEAPLWQDAPPQFTPVVEAIERLERQTVAAGGTVLRCGHLYGPGTAYGPDSPVAELVRKRRFPIVGDGGGMFSFVTARDAARATLLALEQDAPGVFNVVDDDPAPVRHWLPSYAQALGAPQPRRVPAWLARPLAGSLGVAFLTQLRGAYNSRAKDVLGWQPETQSWREGFAAHQT